MSAHVLISGTLFKAAKQQTSKAGRVFTTATMKAAAVDSSNSEFWSLLAFSDTAQAELMRLGVGEKLSVQGSLKLETYDANSGETRISRTVFADYVLALRAPPKERKPKPATAAPARQQPPLERVNIMPAASPDLDDDIPF